MKVIVLGGDGFCGWPCAVNLAEQNHEVIIVDNLSPVSYTHLTLPTTPYV